MGEGVDSQLLTLIDLQGFDTRISALEADAARLPKQIEAIHSAVAEAKKSLDALKLKADTTRKDLRGKEKDLEVVTAKRSKAEARLWEVKNNVEYSAVLSEIESIKQEKARGEEEILGLMELQERLAAETREAETRLKGREEQARQWRLVRPCRRRRRRGGGVGRRGADHQPGHGADRGHRGAPGDPRAAPRTRALRQRLHRQLLPRRLVGALGKERLEKRPEAAR